MVCRWCKKGVKVVCRGCVEGVKVVCRRWCRGGVKVVCRISINIDLQELFVMNIEEGQGGPNIEIEMQWAEIGRDRKKGKGRVTYLLV